MKTTVPLMLIGAALALTSCDLFVPPRIACDQITLGTELAVTQERPGLPCPYPEVITFRVSHAPRVDELWAAENGNPSNDTLAKTPVRITAGSDAMGLCPGADCGDYASQHDVQIDEMGALTYQVQINVERMGLMAGAGTTAAVTGIGVTETYGPGNACYVQLDLKGSCKEAPAEEQ